MFSEKPKVLFTCQLFFPFYGGPSNHIRFLAQPLLDKGYEVGVATGKYPGRIQNEYYGIKVYEFDLDGVDIKHCGIKGTKEEKQRYVEFLKTWDIIFFYAAQWWGIDVAVPYLDEISAKKIFWPCGMSGLQTSTENFGVPFTEFIEYYEKMPTILRKMDCVASGSRNHHEWDFLQKHNIPNVEYLPLTSEDITAMKLPDFRAFYGVKKKYIVLNVSSHFNQKGHEWFRQVCLRCKRDDVLFVQIAKEGNECAKDCSEFLHPNYLLSIFDDREMTLAAYKAADIFMLTSSWEYAPTVLYEAASAGCAILTTKVGNYRDFPGVYKEQKYLGEGLEEIINNLDWWKLASRTKWEQEYKPELFWKRYDRVINAIRLKSDSPKVSVIVLAHNQEKYVGEAIQSVLSQTYQNIELIVVDNGIGVAEARNEGFSRMTGEYYMFLDGDDKLIPTYIEKALKFDKDIVVCDYELFQDKNTKVQVGPFDYDTMFKENRAHISALVKRKVFDKVGGFCSEFNQGHEDWDWWLRALKAGFKIERLPEILFLYRKHGESRSSGMDHEYARIQIQNKHSNSIL